MLAAGNTLNQLWRVLERSVVWTTVRMVLHSAGLGIAVLATVLLFVWKAYPYIRNYARKRDRIK